MSIFRLDKDLGNWVAHYYKNIQSGGGAMIPSSLSIILVCNEELGGHQPFSQGTDGARRTTLTTEIVTRQYPDVGTVYESFLRGVKISGE